MKEVIERGTVIFNGLPSGQFRPPFTESATFLSFTKTW